MTARRGTVCGHTYEFTTLVELMAKATPARSGDVLAGCAAESAAERVAAQYGIAVPDPAAATAAGRGCVGDPAAEPAEHLAHDRDVEDVGHLVDRGAPRGQQGRGHELQRAVLRPGDPNPSREGRPTGHLEALHPATLRRRAGTLRTTPRLRA